MEKIDQWLIRTADNWIAGPYPKEQVRKMVLEGKLGLQDEVCPANSYWLFLHEYAEIQKALGIQIPKVRSGEEITETQIPLGTQGKSENELSTPPPVEDSKTKTGTIVRKSIFEPLMEQAKVLNEQNSAESSLAEGSLDEKHLNSSFGGGSSAREGSLAKHQAQVTGSPGHPTTMWKGLLWMMVFAGAVLIWVVIRLVVNR
jgi:hypothetical protein